MADRATKREKPAWHGDINRFARADDRRAIWQLVNTFVPYAALWVAMIRTMQLGLPYGLTLALAVVAAGLLVRIFIFFHDCGHGSFFSSPHPAMARVIKVMQRRTSIFFIKLSIRLTFVRLISVHTGLTLRAGSFPFQHFKLPFIALPCLFFLPVFEIRYDEIEARDHNKYQQCRRHKPGDQ